MGITEVESEDIQDGSVKRDDLNTLETGKAVIRKVQAGDDIEIISSGVDSGTGDVTIVLSVSFRRVFLLMGA